MWGGAVYSQTWNEAFLNHTLKPLGFFLLIQGPVFEDVLYKYASFSCGKNVLFLYFYLYLYRILGKNVEEKRGVSSDFFSCIWTNGDDDTKPMGHSKRY